ncbi:MAG: Leucyl-tRNA synthetase, mitochondrial [Geoglossum umbratile]|nr:MAG: Leucyl-tRNA synthetase, mitochondrial [Geoglossum umbratile]
MQRVGQSSLGLGRVFAVTTTPAGGRARPSRVRYRSTRSTNSSPRLDLRGIDVKWQQRWAAIRPDSPTSTGEPARGSKCFVLPMFPYPSGALHMGHVRVYTIADVLARFKRMRGLDVIHPMAWDAFGLPAENAAIERGVDPETWTKGNIAKMKEQLMEMNGSWDWSREFMTCDPSFYKHTQRIFLLLHERGLAYQAESLVNYDPVDKTVLANEQVDSNGCSWRSGARVEKRRLKQWFLRITAFKEALLEDLDTLADDGNWPERVISMQKNWLGKSKGAQVCFSISAVNEAGTAGSTEVMAFTTRPDTLFGVQYLALGVDHPLVLKLAKSSPELQSFLDAVPTLPPDSKDGWLLKGVHATNPLAFLSDMPNVVKEPLPVYVAPYVLGDYGYGAVMGVPGHDNRDYAFWRENRWTDPTREVVAPTNAARLSLTDGPFNDPGVLTSLCGPFASLTSAVASEKLISELNSAGLGQFVDSWKIRDWLISRQRYWGTPIPMIHCDGCGPVPVPVDQLPVELPKLEGVWLRGKGGNPLQDVPEWVNTSCPSCGGPAKRDTDTMDTFVDSSWYFARFPDPHNSTAPFSPESANAALPVDIYIGGVEHAILHLLYARFISKFLASTSLWPSGNTPTDKAEPFRKLITQGMVHGKTYTEPSTGRFLKPAELNLSNPDSPTFVLPNGERVEASVSYEKMSKSKYNGVDPGAFIKKYGADATRAHVLFSAPVSEVLEWDGGRIVGVQRWFGKVWRVVKAVREELEQTAASDAIFSGPLDPSSLPPQAAFLWRIVQETTRDVTTALETTYSLNTTISTLMLLTNAISTPLNNHTISLPTIYHSLSTLLHLLTPIAPAFASECWEHLHLPFSHPNIQPNILVSPWPAYNPLPTNNTVPDLTCVVQVNGKLRFTTMFSPGPPRELAGEELKDWLVERLEGSEEGKKYLVRREKPKRVVVARGGKVVNFVFTHPFRGIKDEASRL